MILKLDKKMMFGILILVMALASMAIIKTPVIFILITYILMFYFMLKRDESTLAFFITCCLFQNIILIVFSGYFNQNTTTIVILVKEILLYVNVVFNVLLIRLKQGRIKKIDMIAFAFLLLNMFSYVFTSVDIKYQMVASRQLFIPFVCYYLGESLKLGTDGIKKVNKIIISFAVILSIVGLVMYLYSPSELWGTLGYGTYIYNKTGVSAFSYANFYTYDLGVRLQRFISFTADPLATVHYLMFAVLITFELYKKRLGEVKILFSICIVLVVSKSIVIAIVCFVCVKIYTSLKYKSNKMIIKLMIAFCAVIFLWYMDNSYMSNITTSTATSNHFGSFIYGIENSSLLGNGLGTTGFNLSADSMNIDGFDNGYAESFFAVLIAQLGWAGAIMFYGFLVYIIVSAYRKYRNTGNQIYQVTIMLIFLMVIESLFSSSSITLIGTGLYFTYAGIAENL